MPWRGALRSRLPQEICCLLEEMDGQTSAQARELRFRLGCRAELCCEGKRMKIGRTMDRQNMDALITALCGGAVYAHERSMAQGYIALPGGHRAGVCGWMSKDGAANARMSSINAVCIRIARHIPGASAEIRTHLTDGKGGVRSALFLGPPGSGKTTLLRDAACYLRDACGMQIAAADEREELFASGMEGSSPGIDIMHGGGKAEMMGMLLRSMSPQVIVCDEIGSPQDADAILHAARCGAAILTSAHANGIKAMERRPVLRRLVRAGVFERYICLRSPGLPAAVFDGRMKRIGTGMEREKSETEDGYDWT